MDPHGEKHINECRQIMYRVYISEELKILGNLDNKMTKLHLYILVLQQNLGSGNKICPSYQQ